MCDAKIRPFPNDTELACDEPDGHGHAHIAVLRDYAYPGSKTLIEWQEEDRRTFRGEWLRCAYGGGCVLPAGHPRGHATT